MGIKATKQIRITTPGDALMHASYPAPHIYGLRWGERLYVEDD